MSKLPKGLAVGKTKTITVKGRGGKRRVTFRRVAKKGFPQWKIVKSVPKGKGRKRSRRICRKRGKR